MFFWLSKLFWFVAAPTNLLTLMAAAGALLLFTRFRRTARGLVAVAAVGLLAAGFGPLSFWLLRPLEDRFPIVREPGPVAGVIVLGGAIGTVRGVTSMNGAASRMTESVALAMRFPEARIAFTGGDGSLSEAEAARRARRPKPLAPST